jgi:LacI family transcriptional regulator
MRGRVDGLIVMAPDPEVAAAIRGVPGRGPVVLLNCPPDDAGDGDDALTIANYEGAYAMVRHLAAQGHRRIAMVCGAPRNIDASERLRGYRAALRDAGLAIDPRYEMPGDFTERAGYAAAAELAARETRPTALFAANDAMAIGALSALRQAGLRVPEDVAVGGFDDIPMAGYVDPPLSSVHVGVSALGERAATRLLDALRDPDAHVPRRETVPATLVIRGSSGGGDTGPAGLYPSGRHTS